MVFTSQVYHECKTRNKQYFLAIIFFHWVASEFESLKYINIAYFLIAIIIWICSVSIDVNVGALSESVEAQSKCLRKKTSVKEAVATSARASILQLVIINAIMNCIIVAVKFELLKAI